MAAPSVGLREVFRLDDSGTVTKQVPYTHSLGLVTVRVIHGIRFI